jgi:hypothetical protein
VCLQETFVFERGEGLKEKGAKGGKKKTVPAFAYEEATTSMDERNYMQILLLNLHPWPSKYALSKSVVSGLQFLLSPCPPHTSPIDSDRSQYVVLKSTYIKDFFLEICQIRLHFY